LYNVQIKKGISIIEINIIYKLDEIIPNKNIRKNNFAIKAIKKTKIEKILNNSIILILSKKK
jgi:hypothetical protein